MRAAIMRNARPSKNQNPSVIRIKTNGKGANSTREGYTGAEQMSIEQALTKTRGGFLARLFGRGEEKLTASTSVVSCMPSRNPSTSAAANRPRNASPNGLRSQRVW